MEFPTIHFQPADAKPASWDDLCAERVKGMKASEIRELLKILERPGITSFAGGIPDPALFPKDEIQDAYAGVLSDPDLSRQSLQYSISEGYLPLRRWIVDYMKRRGVTCGLDNVVITTGSQQGLDILAKLLVGKNDTVLVTAPTYLGAIQAFNAYEPRYDVLLPGTGNATPQSYRDAAASSGSRLAMGYVVPDFANPTGETLDEAARHRLIDLMIELDLPLIEDAAYEALRFEGEAMPSLLALDIARRGHIDQSRVMYCGSFSKTIAPGLRVGWLCASRDIVQKFVLAKQAADLHSATLNQMVIHRIAESLFDAHVASLIPKYAERRDAMLAALHRHMPEGVEWTKPQGGMFVWVSLPTRLDGAEILAAAIEEAQVAFVPGGAFFVDGCGKNTIRLNFSLPSVTAIDEGISRLGRLIAHKLALRKPEATGAL